MKITPSFAHVFGIVSTELRKIYAQKLGVKETDVCLIMQGKVTHVLIKGKPYEKLEIRQLSKLKTEDSEPCQ